MIPGEATDANSFFLYDASGAPMQATASVVDPDDNNVVQVTFPDGVRPTCRPNLAF